MQRRSSSPISSLPAETLIRILLSLVEPIGTYQPQSWQTHVELTRVCRHWRSIAMGCPTFWSCIPLTNWESPIRLKEVLTRSQDCPLSIRIRIFRPASLPGYMPLSTTGTGPQVREPTFVKGERAVLELLKAQAYRMRHLHLEVEFTQIPPYQALITEDTPCLESLSVVYNASQISPNDPNSLPNLFDPHHLFDTRTMPFLRHLHLEPRVGTASWLLVSPSTSLILSSLITLKLHVCTLGNQDVPHHFLLLDILRACTRVQTVDLWCSLPDGTVAYFGSTESQATGRVHLPHLISLILRANHNTTASAIRFLSHLSVPPKAGVDLRQLEPQLMGQLESLKSQSDLIRDLFPCCVSRGTQRGRPYTTRSYEVIDIHIIHHGVPIELRLSNPCSCEAGDGKHCSAHDNGPLTLNFMGLVDEFTSMVLERLNFQNSVLKELRLVNHDDSDPWEQLVTEDPPDDPRLTARWRSFFTRHPTLRRITFDTKGKDVRAILNALAVRSTDCTQDSLGESQVPGSSQAAGLQADTGNNDSMASDQSIPLPLLQALELEDGVLGRTNIGLRNFLALESMLTNRAKHGRSIPFMQLSTSPPVDLGDNEMLAKIRQINGGGDVIWG